MTTVTEEQLRVWLDELSNWGRWGPGDQRGTLNYITPDVVKAATHEIELGRQVSCALRIGFSNGDATGVQDGTDIDILPEAARYVLHGAEDPDPDSPIRFIRTDAFLLTTHGIRTTHLDAPSHTAFRGRLYNDTPMPPVSSGPGEQLGSVEIAADGIMTRAVLLDIPRVTGRDWLDESEPIMVADLEACEQMSGVRVGRGDMLMIRTGFRKHNLSGPAKITDLRSAGLDASCLPWLHEREISILATDVVSDVVPPRYPGFGLPIHTVGMWAMGLWIIDSCNLERLAETCIELDRWSGCVFTSPLLLENGTGSPINPVVVF